MPIKPENNPTVGITEANRMVEKSEISGDLKEVREIYSGWNSIYKLETEDQKYCLRIFTNDFGKCGVDWKADKEHYMHQKMVEKDIKTPKSLFKDTTKSIIDYNYVILEFEDGEPLERISNPLTDRENYLTILEDIGKQMAVLHSTSMPKLSKHNFPLENDCRNLEEGIKTHLDYCPDEKTREKILDKLNEVEGEISNNSELVPIHTEITDRNVLVKDDSGFTFSSIIDVEWSMISLPEREFARPTFELLYYQNNKEQFRTRLKHLLKGYYRKGGRLNNLEALPLMIIHHLLWGSREDPEKNLGKIQHTLENGNKLVEEYREVIGEIDD